MLEQGQRLPVHLFGQMRPSQRAGQAGAAEGQRAGPLHLSRPRLSRTGRNYFQQAATTNRAESAFIRNRMRD